MTKKIKEYIKLNLPYFGSITRKYRYTEIIKDKAWSLLSDYVRCRDTVLYGTCVATNQKIYDWRSVDAGHFYPMAGNGALIGFEVLNVHAQSKNSNQLSGMADGAEFERNLIYRYGEELPKKLRELKFSTIRADDLFFIDKIKEVWCLFHKLKSEHPIHNYPDYLK